MQNDETSSLGAFFPHAIKLGFTNRNAFSLHIFKNESNTIWISLNTLKTSQFFYVRNTISHTSNELTWYQLKSITHIGCISQTANNDTLPCRNISPDVKYAICCHTDHNYKIINIIYKWQYIIFTCIRQNINWC